MQWENWHTSRFKSECDVCSLFIQQALKTFTWDEDEVLTYWGEQDEGGEERFLFYKSRNKCVVIVYEMKFSLSFFHFQPFWMEKYFYCQRRFWFFPFPPNPTESHSWNWVEFTFTGNAKQAKRKHCLLTSYYTLWVEREIVNQNQKSFKEDEWNLAASAQPYWVAENTCHWHDKKTVCLGREWKVKVCV